MIYTPRRSGRGQVAWHVKPATHGLHARCVLMRVCSSPRYVFIYIYIYNMYVHIYPHVTMLGAKTDSGSSRFSVPPYCKPKVAINPFETKFVHFPVGVSPSIHKRYFFPIESRPNERRATIYSTLYTIHRIPYTTHHELSSTIYSSSLPYHTTGGKHNDKPSHTLSFASTEDELCTRHRDALYLCTVSAIAMFCAKPDPRLTS